MSSQQIDTQARLLSARLKIEDFRDARKLDAFITRFAANYDMRTGDPTATNPTLALFGAGAEENSGAIGVDFSLILRRQNANR